MKIFTRYFHFNVISFETFKLLKFVTFLHIDLCMQKVIFFLGPKCHFWANLLEFRVQKGH